jgi:uncharacterized protein (TIGR03437 family)
MLDRTGKIATSIGGVQVSFDGISAPLIYVSATQINCTVPHGIQRLVNPSVQVSYQGRTSSLFDLTYGAAAPALFTANGSGTGPAAAFKQDGSYSTPTNPAAKGSIVALFLTGVGETSPPGLTGTINGGAGNRPLTAQSVASVRVLIGGQPATVAFYGDAPGLVSGVMQLSVQIPSDLPSGNVPISVSVGGNSSPEGVTISVQ